jgi:HSP20 family protein
MTDKNLPTGKGSIPTIFTVLGQDVLRDPFGHSPFESFFDILSPSTKVPSALKAHDTHYHLNLDMPGVPKDSINVELKHNRLVITASHTEKGPNNETTVRQYSENIALPDDVVPTGAKVKYTDGVLKVTLPKIEAEKGDATVLEVE